MAKLYSNITAEQLISAIRIHGDMTTTVNGLEETHHVEIATIPFTIDADANRVFKIPSETLHDMIVMLNLARP